ncbi:MAG: Flp pilus assembly protein CpaB [Caulobacter sp.]|nr:Flp pilus assembly protein CpaB [Caulobacter sp.]
MRVATIASLGASALLGIGALFVAKVWLPNAQQGPSKAAAATVSTSSLASVVAASGAVAFGQPLEAKNLTVIKMPADSVPEGAYSRIDQVVGLDGGAPVTLTALVAHEPILPSKVSGAGAKPSVAATISPGMRAYTIKVNDVAGGGGHVLPGDRVDVFLVQELTSSGSLEGASGAKTFISSLVIQNVRVLGMDLIADPASTEKFPPKTTTLEVDVMDAGKLAAAGEAGTLSLSLRRSGATEIADVRPMTLQEMLRNGQGASPSASRRAAAPVRRARATSTAPASRGLVVTQGDKSTVVTVPSERIGS